RIGRIADRLVGVDADAEGVAYLKENGFPETYVDNVEQLSHSGILSHQYDVIVAGEIIEHLENPGRFLRSVQMLMRPGTELIVTTINAYCFFRFIYYLLGNEMVHEDHNYYFSPKVLRKLITRCGLDVVEFKHYCIGKEIRALNRRRVGWLDDFGKFFFPRATDGILLKARLRTDTGSG